VVDAPADGAVTEQRGALAGIRVLDLSRVLAGPLCCMMLGDHGADVIKVEPPFGDETRTYGPPFVDGESTYSMALNRNKRGIVLDLSQAEGQEIVRRLIATSDVLVENFKTGTMERWGLGYEALRTLNPRLVYVGISGFGRSGPYANVAGYDGAIQALGGIMSVTGEAAGGPLKVGVPVVDLSTGLFATQGALLALHHRSRTGLGQKVDVSLLDSVLALMHPHAGNYLNAGAVGGRTGSSHPYIAPYDLIQTADRPIYLPVGNEGQLRRLAEVIERPELVSDPRFRTNKDRVQNRTALLAILEDGFRTRTAAEWCRRLWDAGVPAGPVNSVDEVFADPHVVSRGMATRVAHPGLASGVLRTVAIPVQLEDSPGAIRRHPPRLGEHTAEVLTELGFTSDEVAQFLRSGTAVQLQV
jgi:crotonobetainyl-CoA:carnitine CoA-transferase CaiB-like acyl-CoA transferase